jgi:hypothetical protein
MRDLNEDLSKQPFNEEMKEMAQSFANLLKPMIETVNRFGLRAYHLRRHKASVKIDFMTSFLNGAIRPRLRSATRGASSGTQASFSHSLIMTGFLGTAPTLSTPSRLSCDFAEALTAKAPQKESRIILFSWVSLKPANAGAEVFSTSSGQDKPTSVLLEADRSIKPSVSCWGAARIFPANWISKGIPVGLSRSRQNRGRKAAEKGLEIRPLPNQPGRQGQESLKSVNSRLKLEVAFARRSLLKVKERITRGKWTASVRYELVGGIGLHELESITKGIPFAHNSANTHRT